MLDVQPAQTAQPSVFDAMPTIAARSTNALTRSSGTVLHVERDASYILVCRVLVGTCTREEWDRPEHRRLTIARAWQHAADALRVEDEELVAPLPVTLYRDHMGRVVCADISLPGRPRKLVTPEGRPAVATPADLALARVERTTYAHWAEGPLPHLDLDMRQATTPDTDRDIQYLRHQNRALMELIDASMSPSEWAPEANTVQADDGLVDFRMRGVFRRRDYRQLVSKQTGEASGLLLSDGYHEVPPEATAAPTNEAALDALLNAD